ncbi:MAG: hypothetical protein FWH05_02030, partial [Oscillospiraceae bacterium]|nr:hypothetical protein [Oscillospiraceae bacterium]
NIKHVIEEFTMLAEQNPQVEKTVVRLMELSADEKTRLVYESRHKMEWDNWARERAAVEKGRQEIIERFRRGGMSDEEINRFLH